MDGKIDTALLIEALEAHELWNEAEDKHLGTFHQRMDLCSYAQFMTEKALAHVRGLAFDKEWAGVPRLVITTSER